MMENQKDYTLDLSNVADREQLHELLKQNLDMPDWYGRNLDALFDVLGEKQGTIRISGFDEMEKKLADYARSFRAVCEDAMEQTPGLVIQFEKPEDFEDWEAYERMDD